MTLKISNNGISLIKKWEGICYKAYKCADWEPFYTIGIGHYSEDVKSTDTITDEDAIKLFKKDIAKFEDDVNKWNTIYKWNQNEFDALCSFAFNLGSIDELVEWGRADRAKIISEWKTYNKSFGNFIQGLYNRRCDEVELFQKPIKVEKYKQIQYAYKVRCICNDGLYIREYPTIQSKIIGSLKKGDLIYAKGCLEHDEFLYVAKGNIRGFIRARDKKEYFIEKEK